MRYASGAPPKDVIDVMNETELDPLHEAELAAALTWAIDELEGGE